MTSWPRNLLLLFASATCLAAENAIVPWENAGFEQNLDAWTVQRGNFSTPAEAAHEGKAGLRIDATENATLNYPLIPVDGMKKYRLRLWIRGSVNSLASVSISFQEGSGKAMDLENANDYKKALPTGKEWKEFSFEFTPPESASVLHFKLGVWPKKDATAFDVIDIDGISLEELP
jgi:hypothetical protein